MYIVVVGCGRVGAELAFRLFRRGHHVAVVDQASSAFEKLHPDYRGRTVQGEVLSREVLERAGIEHADGLAAVTNSDSVNAVLGRVARVIYRVPNVVVRNYDPRFMPLHEAFGSQVVSSTIWGAQRIEDLLQAAFGRTVFSAGHGEVEICEFRVPDAWRGRRVGELLRDLTCVPVAVTRAGRAALLSRETRLEPGDLLHVAATREGIEELRRRFAGQLQGG